MKSASTNEYKAIAAGLKLPHLAVIDGELRSSASGRTFPAINPADGSTLTAVADCQTVDIDEAAAAARRAFEDGRWSRMPLAERRGILLKLADLIDRDCQQLAVMETLDSGKPISCSLTEDVPGAAESFRFAAESMDKINSEVLPADEEEICLTRLEPYGVCAAVLLWNFPLGTAAMKIAPILAAGNSVIAKPASAASLTTLKLGELALEAGIPAGVLNVVPGKGSVIGEYLGKHPDVDLITFTGSTDVGKSLLVSSGSSNTKRVLLELGGKSPAVVMPGISDPQAAAEEIVAAALWNMGENCTQNSRILLHEDIHDEMVSLILKEMEAWQPGDPLDPATMQGALISREHMEKVLRYIETGKKEGARLLCGGRQIMKDSGGCYLEPGVFDGCSRKMTIMQEEIFGPLFGIETFRTVDEAIAMANDTRYGLQASVYADDVNEISQLCRGIRAGVISVNEFSEGGLNAPFGGFKQSGFFNRDNSLMSIRQFMELKTVIVKVR
ncbi:MAG: aldehyde dehydrogenase family protein [Anaerovoracaceae bacterium]|jgi:gamma-glutamyl-gamma-aminobutyraldehyde dehydrogenase